VSKPKTHILDKSKELFERFGYQKTTLTDIAKSVGKVKTAIYYYFSGKEEIFAQLVKQESEEFFTQLQKAVDQQDSPLSKLECYVETRITLMQKISSRYGFLKQEFFELMPIVEENRKEAHQKEQAYIEAILTEGSKEGSFNVTSPAFGAAMLVGSLKGLEIQMYVTDQILVEGLNLKDFRDYILYGVIQS